MIVHWHSGWPENRHEPLSLPDSAHSGNARGARIARSRIASTAGRSGNSLTCAKTAAFHLLRRFGAERCGNPLAISRARLMARLRETQEHPDWRWGAPTADRSDLDCWLAGHDAVCGRQTHHPLPRHGTFGGTIGFGGEGARHRLRSHATSGRKRTLAPSSLLRARCWTIQFASGLMSRDPNRFELPKKRENSSSGST